MISLSDFEQQWLESILQDSPSTTNLGRRFAEKILRDWHEIDDMTAEIILCDGAGDGGIDAAVYVPEDLEEELEGDTWILIQSKYGSSYQGGETIAFEAQKLFATLEGKKENLSSLSNELVARLRNFIASCGPKDRLEYILATNRKLTDEQQEYLENIATLGRAKFGPIFHTDHVSIETIYNKAIEDQQSSANKLFVPLRTTVISSSEILYIGATPLECIYHFMKKYKSKSGDLDLLYEKNVRKFLGNKRKVNKGIEKTIDSYPERFGLYNNGITIVAESVERDQDNSILQLGSPYIVNGCQTTKSIWSVLQRKLDSGGSAPSDEKVSWKERLDKAVVITKIVVVGSAGEELLTETTRYTNSQNAVSEKDFIALEKDFRNWTPLFNGKYGVFLEIQRGAWDARKAYQRQNPTVTPYYKDYANAFDLLKSYAAGWLGEAGIAFGKNPPFSPGGTLFSKIVNQNDFGVEALYAAYLVQQLASSYGFGRGAAQQTRGQTRYLFIMTAVDIVKDFLIHSKLSYQADNISSAIIALDKAGLLKEIGDSAIQVIDDYMTAGNEESLFNEPEFQKIRDFNAFLKSEKLGKVEEFSPNLRFQISMAKRLFRRTAPLAEMQRAVIAA